MRAAQESSADLFRAVIGALPDGLAVFDDTASLILCNDAFTALNPLLSDILTPGVKWSVLLREAIKRGAFTAEFRDRMERAATRAMSGLHTASDLELELLSGSVHEMLFQPAPAGGLLLIQRDATERRRIEESEREAEAILGQVLEACPANLVMSRVGDGRILYRSPAATQLLGPIRSFHEHFASREERADFITALLPDGCVDDMAVAGRRPDGRTFPCLISARLIEYRGEEVVVSSSVDISKEVALRRTLAEQREQIFQAEKMSALGELLAGVAHELNNPLSVVVGHSLMMREEVTEPETLRRIDKISVAAERCARIVKSFLAMAREQPAQLAPTDLAETIGMAIDALSHGADGLATPVMLEVAGSLPPVMADSHQLAQVVINLVTNADQAIRASGHGGHITVSAGEMGDGGAVWFAVSDDGPGIPETIRNRIFEPLFTTKQVGEGTGIGLAFCHRVITAHSGTIRLEDGAPGARFVITLPVCASTSPETRLDVSGSATPHRARVLVVDDEPEVVELVSEILSKDGFDIDAAASAEAALALIETRQHALILTDLNMPGIGGKGFFEMVAARRPSLARRIGFVTGDTMSPPVRRFLEGSGQPYLEKPIAPAELRSLARRMLEAVEDNEEHGS
ncbi:MAG: ATP-binding protein [Hyphomonas sp.]